MNTIALHYSHNKNLVVVNWDTVQYADEDFDRRGKVSRIVFSTSEDSDDQILVSESLDEILAILGLVAAHA